MWLVRDKSRFVVAVYVPVVLRPFSDRRILIRHGMYTSCDAAAAGVAGPGWAATVACFMSFRKTLEAWYMAR